jgi:hypothetical protein
MVSGVEVASLVLSVFPILQCAAQAFLLIKDRANTVFKQKTKNEKLHYFVSSLLAEITILHSIVKRVTENLPALPNNRRPSVESLDWASWEHHEVEQALTVKLGSATAKGFAESISTALRIIEHLVQDDSSRLIETTELVSQAITKRGEHLADNLKRSETKVLITELTALQLHPDGPDYTKLRKLRARVLAGENLSQLKDRIKFSFKEGKRNKMLVLLTKCTKDLDRLLQHAQPLDPIEGVDETRNGIPPQGSIRNAISNFYDTMKSNMIETLHGAKICPRKCYSRNISGKDSSTPPNRFDFVVTTKAPSEGGLWLESHVNIAIETEG